MSESVLLKDAIPKAWEYMTKSSYSPKTIIDYRVSWNRFTEFSKSNGFITYNENIAKDFCLISTSSKAHQSAVLMLGRVIKNDLHDFEHGYFIPQKIKNTQYYGELSGSLAKYLEFLEQNDYAKALIASRKNSLLIFLDFLFQHNVNKHDEINPEIISKFISSKTNLSQSTVIDICSVLRRYFLFLHNENYTSDNKSKYVPIARHADSRRLVKLWSHEEIESLLKLPSRETARGKRDYAIIIFGVLLGMRIGDILNLKFDNINWHSNLITIVQRKTNEPLQLPLIAEIGEAIVDYLKNGRPQSESQYLFLRDKAPYLHLVGFSTVFRRYEKKLGIVHSKDIKCGFHTLRHSIANKLLQNNTPLETISSILGHRQIESTNHYLQMDIEGLRQCCLTGDK